MVLLLLLLTGCGNNGKGTVSGMNYYYPEQTEKETQQEGNAENIEAEFSTENYMILMNNMAKEQMLLKQIDSGKLQTRVYSLTTNFKDKYGNNTSVSCFEPGKIITIGEEDSKGRIKSARISDEVWEYEDVVRFDIDAERGIFQIADTKYSFGKEVYVVSAGNMIKVSDIKEDDELRVIGKNKEIISVAVTTGQGTISLKNTELFEDSFIQIGNKIFAEITGEMELEIPEGNYTITVANKGYGGSKEYKVERDKTTIVDLDELKGDGPKIGVINFVIGTTDENDDAEIVFFVDNKEADFKEPLELTYGIHTIEAEAFGYETYHKKLFVNSESAMIVIALDKEVSSAAAVKEEASSEVNTNLAGSLAGSTSNEESEDSSDTDELAEALKDILSENSSTDYLSTLTELLGNIVY